MDKIKELLKRNTPVFVIGAMTIFVFLIIIFTSQTKVPKKEVTLIEVNREELIAPHTYMKGSSNAPVTIIEFIDFGCPSCKAFHLEMEKILEDYPEYVSWGIRHFPLPNHKNAYDASVAAQVAGEQNKFWEFSDLLFENQNEFKGGDFLRYADFLGLNIDKFRDDYKNKAFENLVVEDMSYGEKIGVSYTPTFFLNGKQMDLKDISDLRKQIENAFVELGIKYEKEEEIEMELPLETTEPEGLEGAEENPYTVAQEAIEEWHGIVEISFTEEGFKPKNIQAYAGQLIIWTNNTEEDLNFVQLMPKFPELAEPFVIPAGESFEFRIPLREKGLYTYTFEGDRDRASIFINKLPDVLMDILPETD